MLLVWCTAVAFGPPAFAQSLVGDVLGGNQEDQAEASAPAPEGSEASTTNTEAVPRAQWQADPNAVDYDAWEDVAQRAEQLLLRSQARPFALDRLRAEIAVWRDEFAALIGQNSARLTTVEDQLAALGTAPADGASEATAIAERRRELVALRDLLATPGAFAAEAHARASGIIREIEIQLRDRQTDDLLKRVPSPLLPSQWGGAFAAGATGVSDIAGEIRERLRSVTVSSEGGRRLVLGLIAVIAAVALFLRGRRVLHNAFPEKGEGVQRALMDFLRTVADALIPFLGLVALTYGLSQLDVFGPRGRAVLATVPLTGSVIIVTGWLSRQFFPEGARFGPLNLDPTVRAPARRVALTLAWLTALWIPYDAFLRSGSETEDKIAALSFPVIVVISIVLFRFATLLRTPPSEAAGSDISQGRTRRLIGRLAQSAALVAPLLAALGYAAAAEGVLFPTVLTLGLIGVVVYLQSVTYVVHALFVGDGEDNRFALIPVAIGFALLVVSVPLLALIWGAQRTDLIEYWTRFTEGVSFGETQVSPGDFIWFVVIFSVGYLLTQFIKNALRTSVLPRTRLDLGARNAIVSGFGYIGIFVAAVVAITSAGIDLSNLAIVAGALSVGIGFGLQTIVSNFVSGIILLIERPITEGDWIEVGGKMGYVRDISVRSTRIETFDQTDVIVPNADLVSNQVINWTRGNLVGRLILPVGVAYGSNVDQVMGILRDVAEKHPMVLMNPPPGVLFMNFGADALEFEIRAILRDVNYVMSVRSEMNVELARRFEEAEIEIPFAQRDIWLRNPEVLGHGEPQPSAPASGSQSPKAQDRQKGYDWDSDDTPIDDLPDPDGDTD